MTTKPNKTDAGNGSEAICRVSNVLRSPSPDPKRRYGSGFGKWEYRFVIIFMTCFADLVLLTSEAD